MQSDTSILLKVEHLSKTVFSNDKPLHILNDIDLMIKKGESIAIKGASGSGKTTLLTLLAGLELPTAGSIFFQGQQLTALDEEKRAIVRGKDMGFVFQSFQLLNSLTALENVMLPLEIHYIPHKEAKQRATEWLQKVGLGERLNHFPTKLSGGEQQRVAIARAFVNNPTIIFADEMTGNLDTQTGERIMDILFSINQQQKTTLVLVTHDAILAARSNRCFSLVEGVLQSC